MTDGKTVMIVEDDEDIKRMLALMLELEGYHTVDASDGLDALAKLQAAHRLPDVMIADLMMPHMNGEELLHHLKTNPAYAKIPVLILSGDMRARSSAEKLGARAFLPKPVGIEVLSASVREAMQ